MISARANRSRRARVSRNLSPATKHKSAVPADSPLKVRNCKNRIAIAAAAMPSRTGRLGAP
jgi:hypothetical protein